MISFSNTSLEGAGCPIKWTALSCVAPCPVPSCPACEPNSGSVLPSVSTKAEQRAQTNQAAAEARLSEYFSLGLDPGSTNQQTFIEWHRQRGLQFSASTVDRAVAELGPKLQWQTETAASEAPEPTETSGTLPDGSKQLSLGTTPSRSHTSAQLKDWLRRTSKAAKGGLHRASGSFSSKF